jgi:hypothetical protein
MGGMENSSHTHLPTTWASPQISGISVFNRSSNASVAVILALLSVTVKFLSLQLNEIVKNPLPETPAACDYRITKRGSPKWVSRWQRFSCVVLAGIAP